MAISQSAGIGKPVNGPRTTSIGSPRKPPAMSYSLTSGSGLDDSMNSNGSWPHRITTFIGSPPARHVFPWLVRCAAGEIFVAMDAAGLALGDLAADGLAVIALAAIGAEIEPAVVGVFGDDAARGADEARLVGLVMARNREFQYVDGVALDDVL